MQEDDGEARRDSIPPLRVVTSDSAPAPSGQASDSDELEGANDEALRLKLKGLQEEHQDLDLAISSLEERMPYDRLTIQRMKKRKLALKDEITALHARIIPDIIA